MKNKVQTLTIATALLFAFVGVLIGQNLSVKKTPVHPEIQVGDILAQSLPKGQLVNLIEGATHSSCSHVGIVIEKDGKLFVNEALGTVHSTPLKEWLERSRKDRFGIYRFKKAYRDQLPKILEALEPYQNRPYDVHYDLDDEYIYCSELIFKAFFDATGEELCKTQLLKDLNWKPYEKTIRYLEAGELPLDREIITPIDLIQSEKLIQVWSVDFADFGAVGFDSAQPTW